MTRERFSHANCTHPSTKAGRAACRKALRAAAEPAAAAKPSTPKPGTAKKDPRKTAAPAPVVAAETPADESATDAPAEMAPAAEPTEVTRETWREFRDQRVTVHVVGVEEPFTDLELTGWSIKLIQFKDAEGKSHRLPATTVERVTV